MSQLPTSGLDFSKLSEEEKRTVNLLPAMIYHGVRTQDAILLRMNAVPRSLAEPLADRFRRETAGDRRAGMARMRSFCAISQNRNGKQRLRPTPTFRAESIAIFGLGCADQIRS
jgi:hypothetical protein